MEILLIASTLMIVFGLIVAGFIAESQEEKQQMKTRPRRRVPRKRMVVYTRRNE